MVGVSVVLSNRVLVMCNRIPYVWLHCPSDGRWDGVRMYDNMLAIVIERFGKYNRTLTSGLNFVVPIIDHPRYFTWTRTFLNERGEIVDTNTSDYRIDLRECVFDFMPQEVYTKDTILLDVSSIMYYSIVDVKKAIYEVDDLQNAIVNVAQTQLKEVFGRMTFQECMTSQDQINE